MNFLIYFIKFRCNCNYAELLEWKKTKELHIALSDYSNKTGLKRSALPFTAWSMLAAQSSRTVLTVTQCIRNKVILNRGIVFLWLLSKAFIIFPKAFSSLFDIQINLLCNPYCSPFSLWIANYIFLPDPHLPMTSYVYSSRFLIWFIMASWISICMI